MSVHKCHFFKEYNQGKDMKQELLKALSTIKGEGDWVALRHVREKGHYFMARDARLDNTTMWNDAGVMVEVMINGQIGYAATPDLSTTSLHAAAKRAREQAFAASKRGVFTFDQSVRPPNKGSYRTPVEKPFADADLAKLTEVLIKGTEKLKSNSSIISTNAMAMNYDIDMVYVSSNGAEIEQSLSQICLESLATASKDGETQTRSNGFISKQMGLELLNENEFYTDCTRVGEEAYELLSAENCPSGTMDLLMAPNQLYLQIHESIGHPLELDRILGDERNYAGWSFINPEDFGTLQYGSKLLNVTFDPTLKSEMACYNFDDGGAKAEKEFLIKDGLLVRGLGALESQKRSDIPGVSNFRASHWNRPPTDRMANLNIEAGTSSLEEMISGVEKGVFMNTNRSWSIDDYRNKFQFGCEYAQMIENGKITKTLKNPNYRGVTTPFWNNLKMVGDKSTFEIWGSPYCGKAEPNQVIRVGHACPTCLFENIEIFGGQ